MLNKILNELYRWIEWVFSSIPGYIGMKLRSIFYKFIFKTKHELSIGIGTEFNTKKNILFSGLVYIGKNSFFTAKGGFISIGNNTRFNMNVHINSSGGGKISIGNNCLIGPNVVMRTANHSFDQIHIPIVYQGHISADIIIEDNVWLGSNVVVLPGITIGTGAVVGAGTVITKNVPKMSVVVGVPGKVIKYRT